MRLLSFSLSAIDRLPARQLIGITVFGLVIKRKYFHISLPRHITIEGTISKNRVDHLIELLFKDMVLDSINGKTQ